MFKRFMIVLRGIASVLLACLGPLFVIGAFLMWASALDTKHWPKVDGTIVSSAVAEHKSGLGVTYSPEIRYTYRVGRTDYHGTHIWLLDFYEDEAWARGSAAFDDAWTREIAAQFPAGSSVPVFYKESDPNWSVLKPGLSQFIYFYGGLGLVLTALGMVICPDLRLVRVILVFDAVLLLVLVVLFLLYTPHR